MKDVIPTMITSDVIPYPSLDRVIDATAMPFADAELAAICMHNVFHHIADVESFLAEAARVLKPGGRMLIVQPFDPPSLRSHVDGGDVAIAPHAWFERPGQVDQGHGCPPIW